MLLFMLISTSSTSMVDFDMLVCAFVIIYVLKLIINLPNYVTRYPEGVARVLVQSYPRLLREKNDEGVASKFFFPHL